MSAAMTLRRITDLLGARLLTSGRSCDAQIGRAFVGNHVSSLLAAASADTMLVSSLSGAQLLRLAELMDAPAICLVGNVDVSPELVSAARGRGIALLVSPHDLGATARRLEDEMEAVEAG